MQPAEKNRLHLAQPPLPAQCKQRPSARSPVRATKTRERSVHELSFGEIHARQLRAPACSSERRHGQSVQLLLANQEDELGASSSGTRGQSRAAESALRRLPRSRARRSWACAEAGDCIRTHVRTPWAHGRRLRRWPANDLARVGRGPPTQPRRLARWRFRERRGPRRSNS